MPAFDDGPFGVEKEEDEEEYIGNSGRDEEELDGEDVDEHADGNDGTLYHIGEGKSKSHIE